MNSRWQFVARRIALTIPVLLLMSMFVFLMIHLVPGDPVRTMLGFRATPANVREVTASLGLDKPLLQQYLDWLGGLLHGDLGQDYISHEPLSHLLSQALPVTLELTLASMTLAVAIGIPLGVQAATRAGLVRRLTESFVIAGISIPDFWLGIMLVLLFTGTLNVLPPSGYVPLTEDAAQNLRYMLLPVITLAVGETAYILRTTRGAMEDVLDRPFITYLQAKGLRRFTLLFRHALRNASVPIATVIGIQFGVLLGGAIVIETLFALPGVGRLVVTAINQRNYPVVQAGVLVIAALFLLVNLLTDLLIGWLDPRVAEGARQ
jgi:peptide/nickel transport system permease protein